MPSANENRVNETIAEYLAACDAGTPPDREVFLARNPDIAASLRAFLDDHSQTRHVPGEDPNGTVDLASVSKSKSETVSLQNNSTADMLEPADSVSGSLSNVRYFGDFELLEELARGGMGVVYKARQTSLKRLVALKMILAGQYASRAEIARFRSEAEAAANLDHPNILPIYEIGEHDGHQYFAMKLVAGGSLTAKVATLVKSPREAGKLLGIIARAIHFAHQCGVLHRDLKPANILLDADGTPYVADFGLAKRVDSDSGLTRTGSLVGTPSYMSPEQARGDKLLTIATDIYALGAILFELLTGRPPFRGTTIHDTIRQVIEQEPVNPLSINPSADRDLSIIALKCLEKNPAKRFASAAELADELDRWLRGETILTRPARRGERTIKWVRRNPILAGLLAAVILGSMSSSAFGILATRSAREAKLQADRADAQAAVAARAAADERAANVIAQEETKKAEAAKELAESRLIQRNHSLELLAGVFEELGPKAEEKKGKPLRALLDDQLDKATNTLLEKPVGDPQDVANLQRLLGFAQLGLGHAKRAEDILTKAVTAYEAYYGPDHEGTLNSQIALAGAIRAGDRPNDAVPLLEKILERVKRTKGPEDPTTLNILGNLAATYWTLGQFDRSIPLLEQVLKAEREKLGADDPKTLKTQSNLGVNYSSAGRLDDAVNTLTDCRKRWEKIGARDNPDAIEALNNLATTYWSQGRLNLSVPLFEELLQKLQNYSGPNHPNTLLAMSNLGVNYGDIGRFREAIDLLVVASERFAQVRGADHQETLFCQNALAVSYFKTGQLDRSVPLLEKTLEKQRVKPGNDHPHTLLTMANLGVNYWQSDRKKDGLALMEEACTRTSQRPGTVPADLRWLPGMLLFMYGDAGLLAKAEPLLRDQFKQTFSQLGPDHSQTAAQAAILGLNLLGQNKFAEAEPVLRIALAARQKKDPNAWVTFNSRSMLGEALAGQKKYAEAEPLLLEGYRGLLERKRFIPPNAKIRFPEAVDCLIGVYTALKKPDDVKKWQAERANYGFELAPVPRIVKWSLEKVSGPFIGPQSDSQPLCGPIKGPDTFSKLLAVE